MFKTHKNGFIEVIRVAGLEPSDFKPTEEAATFVLKYLDSPFSFHAKQVNESFDIFATRFVPSFPVVLLGKKVSLETMYKSFRHWINSDLKEYQEEISTPDLWDQLSRETPVVAPAMFDDPDTSEYSAEEKEQLKLSLSQFRLLISETFTPTTDQLKVIDERIEYLSDALERLNKFDWKSILISSVVSIGATLSLSQEQGRVLFTLLKQAFAHIVYLSS